MGGIPSPPLDTAGHLHARVDGPPLASKATAVSAGAVNQRITLQTQCQSLIPEQIQRTVLLHEAGASIVLGDVADVVAAPEPPIGAL